MDMSWSPSRRALNWAKLRDNGSRAGFDDFTRSLQNKPYSNFLIISLNAFNGTRNRLGPTTARTGHDLNRDLYNAICDKIDYVVQQKLRSLNFCDDGHRAYQFLLTHAHSPNNTIDAAMAVLAAKEASQRAALRLEPRRPRPFVGAEPVRAGWGVRLPGRSELSFPSDFQINLVSIYGRNGIAAGGHAYWPTDKPHTPWGHPLYAHAPRGGGGPPPAPSGAETINVFCACERPSWNMPGKPIPPCACDRRPLPDDCHYCCCVVAYPYTCAYAVHVDHSAVRRHVCSGCTHPGQFAFAGDVGDAQLLTLCHRACVDCCEDCIHGQAMLEETATATRIPCQPLHSYNTTHFPRRRAAKKPYSRMFRTIESAMKLAFYLASRHE
jgi:hypothetical protein